MYFRNYQLRKTWLDQCLKSSLSRDPSTENMANGSKHCCNLNDNTLIIFSNYCECSALEKVTVSNTQNRKSVC